MPEAEELQEPPEVLSIKLMVEPSQTDEAPEIDPALGAARTVTTVVTVPDEVT